MPIDKDEVRKKLKEQYDDLNYKWNIERNNIEAKIQHATSDAKKKYEKELEQIQELRGRMKEKLVDLDVASENAWGDVKKGADDAWKDLSEGFKKAVSHFKKQE